MCGIAGVHEYAGASLPTPVDVKLMLDTIVHRGPDDSGVHMAGCVGIGARRLSIIDVAGGHQPIANEDGSIVVAFNGEIYNYVELRDRLRAQGHTFTSDGDTEVLPHLYEQYGDDLVSELRGMFAFAIWDSKRRRLLIARDRTGIKPLYYRDDGRRLVFGSEIKAVLRHPTVSRDVDHDALAAFLLLRYVPAPQTMFQGISSLPAGHLLTSDQAGVSTRCWWDLSFAPKHPIPSESESAARLRELLDDAIRSHLMSDVPYGAFLSGGIDSSLVVALMTRQLGRPVSTFAAGYDGDGLAMSELPYARMVAKRYETNHHEVMIGADDFVRVMPKVVWHLDQPVADNACLPNYMVADLARRSVKMVLTGEGGDELFAGYARYAVEARLGSRARRLPPAVRRGMRWLGARGPGLTRMQIALYALSMRGEASRLALYTPLMLPEARRALASQAVAEACRRGDPGNLFADDLARTDAVGPVHRMLYLDMHHWLPDYLLARGDKTSMAASVEARVPFLDHPLVEYAASLPVDLKMHGIRQKRKYLLRSVAQDLLPDAVMSRPKKGFPVPISAWLRGGAREFCRDVLSPSAVARHGLLDPRAVENVISEHERGTADHGSLLAGLVSLELWHQIYFDGSKGAVAP